MADYTDLLVEPAGGNPELLDQTLQQLPMAAAVVIEGSWNGKTCEVRVFGNPGFVRFAMEQQGYGRVIEERRDG